MVGARGMFSIGQRTYGTGINYVLGDVTLGTVWTHSLVTSREPTASGA